MVLQNQHARLYCGAQASPQADQSGTRIDGVHVVDPNNGAPPDKKEKKKKGHPVQQVRQSKRTAKEGKAKHTHVQGHKEHSFSTYRT